jgi:hypothetical protein
MTMMQHTGLDLFQKEYARDLMAEAAQERLAHQHAAGGLQCRLCLRLGRALMALGRRLEAKGAGELARLGASS